MMHPWDRERTYREQESRGVNWFSLLLSLLLGLFGVALAAKMNTMGKGPLIVPVIFAGLGSLYFLLRGFRGGGCCSYYRAGLPDVDAPMATGQAPLRPGHENVVVTPPAYGAKPASRDTLALRRVFDRFDLLAIERAKRQGLTLAEQTSFLNFARDYVDVDHSLALLAERDEVELKNHFAASLERALLAFQNQSA